jgi:4-hydroxy-tetrahydrodipicolinate reductase
MALASAQGSGGALKIAIAGASGKMGRMLVEAALAAPGVSIHAALDRDDSPLLGQDCAQFLGRECGVRVGSDLAALGGADVLIDFTTPQATLAHVAACERAGVRMVIGTTGLAGDAHEALARASARIAIVAAPNMSVGVNLLARIVENAVALAGEDFDVEVVEAHHRYKTDAPSGTALQLGAAAARARGVELAQVGVYERFGQTGPRPPGSIGFATIRGGDIIGDHTVLLAGNGERIELTHRSSSRATYAQGALRAARFACTRERGLFDMQDVLRG